MATDGWAKATRFARANRRNLSKTSGVSDLLDNAFFDALPSISGSASQLLGSVSQSAVAAVLVQGLASQTLSTVTQSALAAVLVQGSASQSLATLTQAAVGTVGSQVSGSASQTLASLSQTATATVSGGGGGGGGGTCALLLVDGVSFLLQTDGSSHLLLEECAEAPTPEPSGGGGGATPQRFPRKWWDSYKQPRKRKRVVEYAERLADAFAKASADDAERLAKRAETLSRLIAESELQAAYLEQTARMLVEAAQAKEISKAAELAARLEDELRDEEEAEFLLLMI